MKRRYRICTVCNRKWNVSSIGVNPKQYICPGCTQRKNRVPDGSRKRGER